MTTRIDMEAAAVALASAAAARQLALPKNRSKGVPTETPAQLVRMAQDELDEVLHAMRSGRTPYEVESEIGDAVAVCALLLHKLRHG